MNAFSSEFLIARAAHADTSTARHIAHELESDTDTQCALLKQAVSSIAAIASTDPEYLNHKLDQILAQIPSTSGQRRQWVQNGLDDLLAMIEPVIAALMTLTARQVAAMPPARALWEEIDQAATAILELAREPA